MKYFTSAIFFCLFIFFQASAFAGTLCFDKVKLAYVNNGFTENSNAKPDDGNGIYIGYYNNSGNIIFSTVNNAMNLNDGNKGFAMYHALSIALALGLKVSAWDHNITPGGSGTCDDFDEIRLTY